MIRHRRNLFKNIAIITTLIMVLSTMASVTSSDAAGNTLNSGSDIAPHVPILGNRVDIACAQNLTSGSGNGFYRGAMNVLITFSLHNTTTLSEYLANLSNPHSSMYHEYLTRKQFTQNFSTPETLYRQAINYFSDFPNIKVKAYSDRVSLELQGNATAIGKVFGTSLVYNQNHTVYEPESIPTLPEAIDSDISQVSGLNNARVATISPLYTLGNLESHHDSTIDGGYPVPITSSNGVQYILGSDLQVAYNEQSLLNVTFPTNEVIATILWAGNTSSGQHVAPFDPTDVYDYYNHTIPSGEPHSRVYGVPLDHAIPPEPSADEDTTGAYIENTLDLEMVGSMAPGSSIYNVYGPEPTESCLNAAFAYILNPGNKYSNLNNVSVITNSWGTPEFNDTAWYEYLQEAQARGITVLASSGDSGDNPSSPEYQANPVSSTDYLNFPAAMAYNNFGITSVGGTTLTLKNNLQIKSQVAWYETISESVLGLFKIGEVVGSVGGISSVFPEPSWQRNTEANTVINGAGLGVPDIGALANNTAICVSVNGQLSLSGVAGTSVASPTEAGIVAEINAVLNKFGKPDVGYLNPTIFNIGDMQMKQYPSNHVSSTYASDLPALPFFNVHTGANDAYTAVSGYNLVTGWGSINAYNLTIFLLARNFNYEPYAVSSLKTDVNLTTVYANSTLNGNTERGFSMVQSYYVSDELGAPLYYITSFANLSHESNGSVKIQIGLRSEFPFVSLSDLGQASNCSVTVFYINNMQNLNGSFVNAFTNNSDVMKSTLSLTFMDHTISINIPGGAYIIDGKNYTYVPNLFSYSGPLRSITTINGTLSPKFAFQSLYTGGILTFTSDTSGTVMMRQEEMGQSIFRSTISSIYKNSTDNVRSNILWVKDQREWLFSNNANVNDEELYAFIPSYEILFQADGIRSGNPWVMSVENGPTLMSTVNEMSIYLVNGTYTAGFTTHNYTAVPGNYSFTISGHVHGNIPVEFQSASNRTLLRQLDGLNPVSNLTLYSDHIQLGTLNETAAPSYYSMTSQPGNKNLFLTYDGLPWIYVVNITTDRVVKKIYMGNGSSPQSLAYDNSTSQILVYSSGTGNISMINPLTYSILGNITVAAFIGRNATLKTMVGGENAILFNKKIGFVTLNITEETVQSSHLSSASFQYDSSYLYANSESIYFINTRNDTLDIYTEATGDMRNMTLPSSLKPETLIYSGYGQVLYISGKLGNAYTLLRYNMTTESITSGPILNALAMSSSYDNLSGMTYVSTLGPLQMMYIVSPVNLSVAGSAPFVIKFNPSQHFEGVYFNWNSQDLYVDAGSTGLYKYTVQHFYRLTVHESGLPSHTLWNYTITNSNIKGASTDPVVSYEVHNGTYQLTGNSTLRRFILYPYTYPFEISGKAMLLNLTFVYAYPVLFEEQGLPAGTPWYLNVSNIKPSGIITANHYTILLPNGTHEYSLATSLKIYAPVNHTSTLSVSAQNFTVKVRFYLVTYEVTVTETGIYSGSEWYIVNSTGKSISSLSPSIELKLPNGTYIYNITELKDYYMLQSTFTFEVHGKNQTIKLEYFHYAYLIGTTLPGDANVIVNGKTYNFQNGNVNISLKAGYYTLKVTENGYNYYYRDFSVRPGQVENIGIIKLSQIPTLTPTFYYIFYGALIGAIAFMVFVGVYFAVKRRDR